MTSTTFEKDINDGDDPFVIRRTWSSEEEETEVAGSNREKNGQEEQEIFVKWQLPGTLPSSTDVKKHISNLLRELLMCYVNEITLIDQRGREWMYTSEDQEERFVREFGQDLRYSDQATKNFEMDYDYQVSHLQRHPRVAK